jgi:hypothetical protein
MLIARKLKDLSIYGIINGIENSVVFSIAGLLAPLLLTRVKMRYLFFVMTLGLTQACIFVYFTQKCTPTLTTGICSKSALQATSYIFCTVEGLASGFCWVIFHSASQSQNQNVSVTAS